MHPFIFVENRFGAVPFRRVALFWAWASCEESWFLARVFGVCLFVDYHAIVLLWLVDFTQSNKNLILTRSQFVWHDRPPTTSIASCRSKLFKLT